MCVFLCVLLVYLCLYRPEVTLAIIPQALPIFYAETVSFTVLKLVKDAILAGEPSASVSVFSVLGSKAHHHTQLVYMGPREQAQVLMFARNALFRMSHLPSLKI